MKLKLNLKIDLTRKEVPFTSESVKITLKSGEVFMITECNDGLRIRSVNAPIAIYPNGKSEIELVPE